MPGRLIFWGVLAIITTVFGIHRNSDAVGQVKIEGLSWRSESGLSTVSSQADTVRFAVIGDYGDNSPAERDVARLVKSWHPDFIITTGDNNYDDGSAATIDQNIGQYYREYIFPYPGVYPSQPEAGPNANRFFPTLGNHDWNAPNAQPHLDYFSLPGNERYYEFSWGPVQFFAIDSDEREPDGTESDSHQVLFMRITPAIAAGKIRPKTILAVSQTPVRLTIPSRSRSSTGS